MNNLANQDKILRIQNMLRTIDPIDKISTIQNALNVLAARVDNSDDAGKQALNQLNDLSERENHDDKRIDNLIQSYETYLDRQLPNMLRQIESKINDYISANKAAQQFNYDFFSNIPMSLNAKQEIAAALIKQVKLYTNTTGPAFWTSLINGNTDTLLKVLFVANPNSTLDFESTI